MKQKLFSSFRHNKLAMLLVSILFLSVSVNIGFLIFSHQQMPILVDQQYFEKGILFQDNIEARKRLKENNINVSVTYLKDGNKINVKINSPNKDLIKHSKYDLELQSANDSNSDENFFSIPTYKSLNIKLKSLGIYFVTINIKDKSNTTYQYYSTHKF